MLGNSQDLELIKLQIEKQHLEIQVLELEAQAKARSLSSPSSVKPAAIPLLDTVHSGHNASKSQGQLDHNTHITNPQEWPHLHVTFGFAGKKFKDLTTSEFVYGYLDIVNSEPPEKQDVMTQHLMSLMQLASKYNWPTVLSFHAAVLDRIPNNDCKRCVVLDLNFPPSASVNNGIPKDSSGRTLLSFYSSLHRSHHHQGPRMFPF